jgi:hypothetical protein
MLWDISEGTVQELDRLSNDGILLSLRNQGKRRHFIFLDDQLRERLFLSCYEDSCNDSRFSKYYHTIEPNKFTFAQLQFAQENQSFAYVGTFEFRGIKFVRAICSSFPIHHCILRQMFEFSKDAQIFDSLKSVAEKILSHEDEFDGKFLFFDKEGKFLGAFPGLEDMVMDRLENNQLDGNNVDDIERFVEQITGGEAFLFEKEELTAHIGAR